jgi:hypothetical protein
MHSFRLGHFFLVRDGYDLSSEVSVSQKSVKAEPLSPLGDDCNFAYACNITKTRGSRLGHVVELPF